MSKLKKIVKIVSVIIAAAVVWFIMITVDCRSVYPQGRPVFAFIMTEDGETEVYHGLGYSVRLKRLQMGSVCYSELLVFGQSVSVVNSEEYFKR